jgi:hypothetical protein
MKTRYHLFASALILSMGHWTAAVDLPVLKTLPVRNSCFLNSVLICQEIQERFQKESLWCDILAVAFLREKPGETFQEAHAVAVVDYGGGLYDYDVNMCTLPFLASVTGQLGEHKQSPLQLARAIWPGKQIIDARFLAQWNRETALAKRNISLQQPPQ